MGEIRKGGLEPFMPTMSMFLKKEHCDDETRNQLAIALKRIDRLEADLAECLDYFKDRYDVVDGDYGEPAPNTEMQLGMMIDETLNGRPV